VSAALRLAERTADVGERTRLIGWRNQETFRVGHAEPRVISPPTCSFAP
jgi:hypothetical protein